MLMNLFRQLSLFIIILYIAFGARSQELNLSSNLLYDSSATINVVAEIKLGQKYTFQVPLN